VEEAETTKYEVFIGILIFLIISEKKHIKNTGKKRGKKQEGKIYDTKH
jgi:hypothetical protein